MAFEFIEDSRLRAAYSTLGKGVMNAIYPDEFELYIIGFELVNYLGQTVEFFVFPINPKAIRESINVATNIKVTAGGVTAIDTDQFIPTDITLNGNFGRKLKFLSNQEIISFAGISFNGNINSGSLQRPVFSKNLKTGFGCLKTLQRICELSNKLDEVNKSPYSLYFYNLALGNSYLVKYMNLTFDQDESTNMIWNYSLTLKSLSKLDNLKQINQKNLSFKLSTQNVFQKVQNSVLNSIRNISKI